MKLRAHPRVRPALYAAAAALSMLVGCATGPADPAGHRMADDPRVEVRFPDMMRTHTLAQMRDHLRALAEIQDLLARGAFDQAADTAEQRLGLSSLGLHGAHDVAPFMPKGMQESGTAMHRSASRFALAARDTSATGNLQPAVAALAEVTQACVACHAGYRLR